MAEPEHYAEHDVASAATRAGGMYRDFVAAMGDGRVAPRVDRAKLAEMFAGTLGDEGVGLPAMLDEFESMVLPNSMATPHPTYMGLVNSSPLAAAPIADLLVSMLNNNGGAFHQSPAGTAAEGEVKRAFCEVLGYPSDASGMLLPGGTFANLHGLLLARTAKFPEWNSMGPEAVRKPRLYTSEAVHFSNTRGATVIGLGTEQVIAIPTIGRDSLDPAALRDRIMSDLADGATPFVIVATLGTAGTGSIDDLAAIAKVAREFDLWLHVDCCYGGGAALLDEFRGDFAAIAQADSVSVDPHKWFFLPITAGLALTTHPDVERAAFQVDASYIPSDGCADAIMRGVPTSRRNYGLSVWSTLRAHGFGPIRAAVRRNIGQMRRLEERLAARGFRILPDGRLSIACARYEPEGLGAQETDALQAAIAKEVVARGDAWFATTRHRGETWLRFNAVNLHTRDHHIDALADSVAHVAESR